jgi:Uma2 family endonuclease
VAITKYGVYEQAGVAEYWLVNVHMQTIEVFVLDSGQYRSLGTFWGDQRLVSRLIPDATIAVGQFFNWARRFS